MGQAGWVCCVGPNPSQLSVQISDGSIFQPAHVDKVHVKSILNSQSTLKSSGHIATSKGSFIIAVLWSPYTDFTSRMFL